MDNNVQQCIICLNDQNDGGWTKLDCEHTFHASCVINWFRQPNSMGQCPLCRSMRNADADFRFPNDAERLDVMRKLVKHNEAPKTMTEIWNKFNSFSKKSKEASKEFRIWRSSTEGKEFQRLLKIHRKYREKKWRLINKMCVERRKLLAMPIPLLVKQPLIQRRSARLRANL